jgi:glyoxylase-like metal-dependent hydrolase (beta-lactamase superfamily II)
MTSADQRDQLLALAERCERTGRPDRNLDADIYEALGFTVRRKPTTLLAPRTPPGGIYQQGSLWKAIGKISAEIDVAVSVIREKAPDWNWSLRQAPHRSATGTGRALKRFPFQRRSRFSGQIDSAGLYRGVAVSSPHGQLTQGNQTAVEGVVRPASLTLGLSPSPGHDAGWRGAIRGRSCSSRCWSLIMARFEPSRRTVMAGAGVLATAAALDLPAGIAPAHAQGASVNQNPGFYRYKVGDITVTALNDGFARRPLEGFVRNAELADVKKAMEQAYLPSDALSISFTTLALQIGDKLVLIDTGNGDSGAPTSGAWMKNFQAAGLDPKNVSTVVFSHFHGDHINGFRLKDGSAVFPNAEVMVPAAEWAFWMDDAKMNAAPEAMKGAFNGVRRVFGPVAKDVKQYEAGKEIVPGVTAIAAPGHTPGHTVYAVSSGSGKLMVMSDTTNHPALFVRNPDWSAVFDMDGPQAAATRRKLLDMAVADKMQVAFYHAPFPATGHIAKAGNGYELVPVQWSSAI